MRRPIRCLLFAVLASVPAAALAADPADVFSGRYGHDASEPAYEPVWEVRAAGAAWRAGSIVEGGLAEAVRLSAAGREAFWRRMHWPVETSRDADCLSWGERAPDLVDLMGDAPAVAPPDAPGQPDAPGHAVLCHVPPAARKAIDWLADGPHDWFYYDAVAGVMGVRPLR